MADAKTIPLESIRIDGATQPRCMIDEAAVAEYAEDMRDGFPFPPVTVFHDGAVNWLADGFHRYHGARRAGLESILARVESGTVTDARWFACGANRAHGLRRTNADKRRAVEMALKEHPEFSDEKIAGHVGVHRNTVLSVRHEVAQIVQPATRTGADGKQYPLPPPRPIPPVPPPLPPPAEAPQTTDAEHAILEREPEEIRAAVAEYMVAHPAVSYCQALSLVKRKGVPGEDPRLTRLRAAGEDEQRKIDEEKRAGTVEYGPPPAAAAVVRDAVGQEVPPELHALWARRQEAQDLLTSLSRIRGAVRRCEDEKDPLGATVNYNSLHAHLDQAYADLECMKPYAVCTSCHGLLGCRLCGGSGLLSKFRWDTCVSREQKKAVAGGQEA